MVGMVPTVKSFSILKHAYLESFELSSKILAGLIFAYLFVRVCLFALSLPFGARKQLVRLKA